MKQNQSVKEVNENQEPGAWAQLAFLYVYGKHKDKTMGLLSVLVIISFFSYAIETEENHNRVGKAQYCATSECPSS